MRFDRIVATDVTAIYNYINSIHDKASAYETNFYAGKEALEHWINWKQVNYVLLDNSLFLLRKNKFSSQVYYFAYDRSALAAGLKTFTAPKSLSNEKDTSLVVDYLGNNDDLKTTFEEVGFQYHISLNRMTRINKNGFDADLEYGEYATLSDAETICNILEHSMDLISDQVPEPCEIENYIAKKQAIVIRDGKDIISCILWVRRGLGMEWKYWALNPKYKGTTHSINLLYDYLKLNGSVVRTTLFVRDRNPASAIYQRIGFKYDGLKDFVYRKGEE